MVAEADKQAAKLEADAAKKAEKAGQDGEKASVAVLKAAEKDAAALTRASKWAPSTVLLVNKVKESGNIPYERVL